MAAMEADAKQLGDRFARDAYWPGDTRPLWLRALESRLSQQHHRCTGRTQFRTRCRQRAWFVTTQGEPRCGHHRTQEG